MCMRARPRTHIRTENAHEFIKLSRAPPCRSSLVSKLCACRTRCGRRLTAENSQFRIINYFVANIEVWFDERWHYLLFCDNLPIFSITLKDFANYQRINRSINVRYFYLMQTFLYYTAIYFFQHFYSRYQFVYLISKDFRKSCDWWLSI